MATELVQVVAAEAAAAAALVVSNRVAYYC